MELIRKTTKNRFWELDFLRGVCVILMMFDHFMFFAGEVFPFIQQFFNVSFWGGLIDFSEFYWYHNVRAIIRFIVVGLFLILCGISCTLSRSNLKRGLITCLCAAGITMVTYLLGIFGFEATIWFGVIHMLGASMIIYFLFQIPQIALRQPLEKLSINHKKLSNAFDLFLRLLPAIAGLITLALYFGLGYGKFVTLTNSRGADYVDLMSTISIDGSDSLKNFLSMFFEVSNANTFISADYFPILPYAALVLTGGAIGELFYRGRRNKPRRFNPEFVKPVSFVGRNALLMYLGHQAIIAVFFAIAALIASL